MENSLLMCLTALLLFGVREGITNPDTVTNRTETNFTQNAPCPTVLPPKQTTCPPPRHITHFGLGWLKIKSRCEGQLYINYHKQETPLCFSEHFLTLEKTLCKEMGCGDLIFSNTSYVMSRTGFILTSNLTLENKTDCEGMWISCKDFSDPPSTELVVYKALTSILILLILGVILFHFSRPAYKTIRKRFSQKRQSRWIGPTQSQSVSYHRGQGPPNNNTVKRQSYPGLEKLTVNTSREPSSNRNSDYDSYGFN